MRDPGLIPGSGRPLGRGNGNPLQYSCLENPMDGGAWRAHSPWSQKESNMTERLTLLLYVYMDFSGDSVVKNLPAKGLISRLGKSPREGNGY